MDQREPDATMLLDSDAQPPEGWAQSFDELVQLDFKDVELAVVVETIARITSRTESVDRTRAMERRRATSRARDDLPTPLVPPRRTISGRSSSFWKNRQFW